MENRQVRNPSERLEKQPIVLTAAAQFPIRIVLISDRGSKEYRLVKTRAGKLQLVK